LKENYEGANTSREKASNYLATFLGFVILVLVLGTLFPQYFGEASKLLTENLGAIIILVFLSIILYGLAKKE